MKWLVMIVAAIALTANLNCSPTFPTDPFKVEVADAAIKYISGYNRSNGTRVKGHWRDTSNDGNPYNNANYLHYND